LHRIILGPRSTLSLDVSRVFSLPTTPLMPESPTLPPTSAPHFPAGTLAAHQPSGEPLHICLVSNTAWSIYNYRLGLLHALRDAGARVTIIAPEDRAFVPLQQMGCECIALKLASKGTSPIEDLLTCFALYRLYKRLAPDIVFHYTIKPNIYGTFAAAFAKVPSIAVTTGLGYVFLHANRAARIAQTLYKWAFRYPREVWFLNPDDRDAFVHTNLLVHPERVRLLRGEGVDLQRFRVAPPRDEHAFRFILIGRLLWDKGVGEFIEAARRLKDQFPQARWQLLGPVGVANPTAISREQVEAWCAEGLIEYLGEAEDVRPHIAGADCVVLPSYREGVPRTLLEAAAMGRMAIATRVPGCVEVVEDGVNGILCEARDASALTHAMQQVLCMPASQRRAMEVAARQKAETAFDERVVIDIYQQVLDRVGNKTISLAKRDI
jgi:glycosyltransferase involved in cell wall biosynthesis